MTDFGGGADFEFQPPEKRRRKYLNSDVTESERTVFVS